MVLNDGSGFGSLKKVLNHAPPPGEFSLGNGKDDCGVVPKGYRLCLAQRPWLAVLLWRLSICHLFALVQQLQKPFM